MNDSRERLAQIAQQIVQSAGLKGLSFRTLAQEAGIKSSSVHYHFPEKADLAQVLIERYSTAMAEQLAALEQRDLSLRRSLLVFISIFEDVATNNQLCLCGMMSAELDALSEGNQVALQRFFTDMEHWLKKLLDKHAESVASELSHTRLASTIVSGLEGALLVDRVAGGHKRLQAQKHFVLSILG